MAFPRSFYEPFQFDRLFDDAFGARSGEQPSNGRQLQHSGSTALGALRPRQLHSHSLNSVPKIR